ncbi:MAG: exodeoxyribonuclease VII small subunit [Saprospiraceae bacterium]|nr:exodeoxyribonuclease VII small subunit [Saprospiraceae bacterium]
MALPKELTYTDAMHRLQEITSALDAGNVQIDDLDALLLESRELIRFCEEKLRSIDQKIEGLDNH